MTAPSWRLSLHGVEQSPLMACGWLVFALQVGLFQDGLFSLLTLGGAFLDSRKFLGRLAPAAVGMFLVHSPNSEQACM